MLHDFLEFAALHGNGKVDIRLWNVFARIVVDFHEIEAVNVLFVGVADLDAQFPGIGFFHKERDDVSVSDTLDVFEKKTPNSTQAPWFLRSKTLRTGRRRVVSARARFVWHPS
jgi:hypothetical protein